MKRIAINNLAAVTELTNGELQNTVGGIKKKVILRRRRNLHCGNDCVPDIIVGVRIISSGPGATPHRSASGR